MFLWNLPFELYQIIKVLLWYGVLILVFVELTFWVEPMNDKVIEYVVLILVFVELTFWDRNWVLSVQSNWGLNPCFCGTYLLSCEEHIEGETSYRLNPCFCGTYLLRNQVISSWCQTLGLNPCFCGTYLLSSINQVFNSKFTSLNPCFCGTYLLRVRWQQTCDYH